MSSQKGNSKTAGKEVRMILQPSSHYPEGSRVLRKTISILGHKEASYIGVYYMSQDAKNDFWLLLKLLMVFIE